MNFLKHYLPLVSALLFLGLLAPNKAEAQLLKKIKDKIEKSLSTDEERDVNESSQPDNKNQDSGTAPEDNPFGSMLSKMMGGEAKWEASYEFDLGMDIEVESYKKNGSSETSAMSMAFGDQVYCFQSQENTGNIKMINDYNNSTMIMLNEDDKTGQALPLNMDAMTEIATDYAEDEMNDPEYSLRKTGRTKNIRGYQCEEYEIIDENIKVLSWVTQDVRYDSNTFLSNLAKGMQKHMDQNVLKGFSGFLIEATTYKKDRLESVFRVMKIDQNPHRISIDEYNIQSLSYGSTDR